MKHLPIIHDDVFSDPPGPPGVPDAEEVGGDFVSLTWERPKSDGGGRILGYFIEKKDATSNSWVRVNQSPTPANIFNVPNLIEDREYDFRVIAVNEAGESPPAATTRHIKIKDPKGFKIVHLASLFISCFYWQDVEPAFGKEFTYEHLYDILQEPDEGTETCLKDLR